LILPVASKSSSSSDDSLGRLRAGDSWEFILIQSNLKTFDFNLIQTKTNNSVDVDRSISKTWISNDEPKRGKLNSISWFHFIKNL
jgi:hypothetical protein